MPTTERVFMLRRCLFTLAFAALVFAAVANAGTAKSPGLVGESGPGFSIEVKLNGKDVKTLKAGTYKIKVEDKSAVHNFHLFGKGLNKTTTIPFTGDQTWTIKLKPGTYTYQCDAHASSGMKGTFKVKS
jgi:plastocyanin